MVDFYKKNKSSLNRLKAKGLQKRKKNYFKRGLNALKMNKLGILEKNKT
jgi:hypothetical protein